MPVTPFCPDCGAVNEPGRTHCFSCQQLLSPVSDINSLQQAGLLQDRYQLGVCLGSGGFSQVYRARDLRSGGRPVAIKQISLQGLSARAVIEATETFHREVRMLSTLSHAQVPDLYDHFGDQDHWYLVLEYIEGQTLETFITTRERLGKPLQREEILTLILQLCPALGYLHSRQPPIIFRDLKPGNIMRTPDGSLCLIDFGIARRYQPGQSQDTQRLGSPGYAAPEQYGRDQTTPQTDIYSLGALLHFLLSGQDPSDSLQELPPLRLKNRPGSAELEKLVTRMLSPNPSARPATIREVVLALEAIRNQRVIRDGASLLLPSSFQTPRTQRFPVAGQHQIYLPVPPGHLSSSPARRRITRRHVLFSLGVLTVVAGTGVEILRLATPSSTTPQPSYIYSGNTQWGKAVAWSPDSKHIASASIGDTVQVWNAANGGHILTYQGHSSGISGLAWSPDGRRIASSSFDRTVQVWDSTDGSNVFTYSYATEAQAVAWSPDGRRIASASDEFTVQVWNAVDGSDVLTYQGHSDLITGIAWSPDSRRIASAAASPDHTVQVWDAASGEQFFTYRGHSDSITGVGWSPDGGRIASASEDFTVQVWDAFYGSDIFTYRGHHVLSNSLGGRYGYPDGLTWSPDSKRIASVGNDTMQVWDAVNGGNVLKYQRDSVDMEAVTWSPDGKHIASVTENGTVLVWNAP